MIPSISTIPNAIRVADDIFLPSSNDRASVRSADAGRVSYSSIAASIGTSTCRRTGERMADRGWKGRFDDPIPPARRSPARYPNGRRKLRRPYLSRTMPASCSFSHAFFCSTDSIVSWNNSTSGGSVRSGSGAGWYDLLLVNHHE
jgi:hypothetical protein